MQTVRQEAMALDPDDPDKDYATSNLSVSRHWLPDSGLERLVFV
jgi:hypothetical protein